jgi:transposase
MMLSLPSSVRIWLATRATDLRKSFDSLAEVVRQQLHGDPLSGQLFVFRNRRGDRLKLLYWDEDGYVLVYKRLEVGTFRFPQSETTGVEIRAADLQMLLDGVDFEKVKRQRRYQRPVPA